MTREVIGDSLPDVLRRLGRLRRFGVRLGLERITSLLHKLGCPHRRFRSVHIAGTNGKGSTAVMVATCLTAAGHRTGLYTSPHLLRFSERIRIDGREIGAGDLVRVLERVLRVDAELTFFEAATAAAFVHFAEQSVDVAVIETGLGGRLDATNVVVPTTVVISRIGLEHTEVLGNTLAKVAREKAGIVKPGAPVVAVRNGPRAHDVLVDRCRHVEATLYVAGRDFVGESAPDGRFCYRGIEANLGPVGLALGGAHQVENAALAVAALEMMAKRGVVGDVEAWSRGLSQCRWRGRMEWIGRSMLDCAHNPDAVRALVQSLGSRRDWVLIFGTLEDKDHRAMLAALLPHVARVVLTRPRSGRGQPVAPMSLSAPGAEVAESLGEALAMVADDPRPRLITGSAYLVGEALGLLSEDTADSEPLWDPAVVST